MPSESQREFEELAALVTGAGSGIGLAVTRHLVAAGARVAGLDLDPTALVTSDLGDRVHAIVADVTSEESCRNAMNEAIAHFGRLDILVNNAGVGFRGTVEDNSDDEWRHGFEVNVLGVVRLSRLALPHLRRSPHPVIVNTCSVSATTGIQDRAVYSTTKGAMEALTRAMAADFVGEGIRVNCVNPGTADTPWVARNLSFAADPVAERAALEARQPLGRLISADEIAHSIAFLASPRCSGTTGTVLHVDGGMHSLYVRPR